MPRMKKPTPGGPPEFADTLTLTTAARQMHLTTMQVRRLMGSGTLAFVQVRGAFRIPKQAIADYLTQTAEPTNDRSRRKGS